MRTPGDTQHTPQVRRPLNDADAADSCGNRSLLMSVIIESWRRCTVDYALDRGRLHGPTVLDSSELAARRDQHDELLQIASTEIDWLYGQIAATGYALVLSDARGVVLYEKTAPDLGDVFHSAGLMAGADWSERCEGTNGIGTCIVQDAPVIIHRDAHFRACHTALTCYGSPIHDASGALAAVLDASTLNPVSDQSSHRHTMALVNLSARLIEKCLFLTQVNDATVLRFHTRPELVNLQHAGVVAVSSDGLVSAVDEEALRLLGAAGRSTVIGRAIDDLFEMKLDDLLDRRSAALFGVRPMRAKLAQRMLYATVCASPRTEHVASSSAVPRVVQVAPVATRTSRLTLEEIAGEDPQMLRNVRSAHRVAASRVPVMIQGPTGAGKEVFARALHIASDRSQQQFVAINCAAIPETLIESELFGYRSGAFTGARKEGMKGKLLQSSGGTLFLDEIGDMPLPLQTRLLRVLEEQEVVPLGSETPIRVDLRVICASHQNLRTMIARGEFREDLYYRLNGITLELPPLAQRTDKERLIREFLAAETSDGRPAAIEVDAFTRLLEYEWPGNIRELRNVIRTALAICDGGIVRLADLPGELRRSSPTVLSVPPEQPGTFSMREAREDLLSAIRACGGNMSRVATSLGISRNTLYRRCKRLGVPLHHQGP